MIYRTVTVTPRLTSGITIDAVLGAQTISVNPVLMKIIGVTPTLSESAVKVDATLSASSIPVNTDVVTTLKHYTTDVEFYNGAYEATPKTDTSTQVFETKEKMMRRDFLVYTIPTAEEYNESGGVTFIIGENYGS